MTQEKLLAKIKEVEAKMDDLAMTQKNVKRNDASITLHVF